MLTTGFKEGRYLSSEEIDVKDHYPIYNWRGHKPKLEIIGGFTVPARWLKYRKRITKWIWDNIPNCRVTFCGRYRETIVTIFRVYPRERFSDEEARMFADYMTKNEKYIPWGEESILEGGEHWILFGGSKR